MTLSAMLFMCVRLIGYELAGSVGVKMRAGVNLACRKVSMSEGLGRGILGIVVVQGCQHKNRPYLGSV